MNITKIVNFTLYAFAFFLAATLLTTNYLFTKVVGAIILAYTIFGIIVFLYSSLSKEKED